MTSQEEIAFNEVKNELRKLRIELKLLKSSVATMKLAEKQPAQCQCVHHHYHHPYVTPTIYPTPGITWTTNTPVLYTAGASNYVPFQTFEITSGDMDYQFPAGESS